MTDYELTHKSPSSKLRYLYIIGLSVIALLTIMGQLFIRQTLAHQSADARIINIAGRQRMLSQKVSKDALVLSRSFQQRDFAHNKEKLTNSLELWEKSHNALQLGDEELGIPKDYNSETINTMFVEIQEHFHAIRQAGQELLDTDSIGKEVALAQILQHEPAFLEIMNAITFQYDKEANAKIARLEKIEMALLIITLAVLLLEALVIFHPAVKKIDAYFRLAHKKNQALIKEHQLAQQYSEEIAAQNEELQQQSEELLTTNTNLQDIQAELEESLAEQESLNEELRQNTEELQQLNTTLHESQLSLEKTVIEKAFMNEELRAQKKTLEEAMKDLKEAQMHLVQSEKLSSLGQLTAGVAHEINNPINFVYAGANTLKQLLEDLRMIIAACEELYPSSDPEHVKEQLLNIQQIKEEISYHEIQEDIDGMIADVLLGAERTRSIVASLRTFTRLDENEVKLADMHENIDSTLIILRSQLGYDIELVKDYQEHLPSVECKISQLNQVFLNIINNAIQAIEGKGKLTIKTAKDCKNNRVCISIMDTGKGMTQETIYKIFDPFYTTKPIGKGTGLGLSICKNIIEKHKGSIDVHSEVGKGTEFIISLPLSQKTENLEALQEA